MASLSGISVGGQQVHVPLSDASVFFVLRVVSGSMEPKTGELARRLASCPGLLFLSMHQVSQQADSCGLDELRDWILKGGLGLWLESAPLVNWEEEPPSRFSRKSVRRYLRALGKLKRSAADSAGDITSLVEQRFGQLIARGVSLTPLAIRQFMDSISLPGSLWQGLAESLSLDQSDVSARSRCAVACCLPNEEFRALLRMATIARQRAESVGQANAPDGRQAVGDQPHAAQGNQASEDVIQNHPLFAQQLQRAKMAAMKQLAYGASHEINNPLANIASRAQTLMRGETDPERRRKLASINQQAFRAHEMIADMMLFAHPPDPQFQSVDPGAIVSAAIDKLQELAAEQGTALECQSQPVNRVWADENQLSVALDALIQNGLEAVKQSGQIQISVLPDADCQCAVFRVQDSGPGIEPEQMEHLFDPFYCGREAGRGLGFGLSKAWRIAELHSGTLTAQNRHHEGALFELRIPYAGAVTT